MNVTVIGTGYVGLVAGTCFSETGNKVICADIDAEKIKKLNNGQIPIYEPGLDEMLRHNREDERLVFTTDVAYAIRQAEVIFIAVGTPSSTDGTADLRYVLEVAAAIGKNINNYKVVVDKSTVPVGTALKVKNKIKEFTDCAFDVVSNPEFLKEGAAVEDFLKPDRVVIGFESEKAKKVMHQLYLPFVRNNHPVLFMDIASAEMTKYAANAMLASRITFMNEIANLCDRVGANIDLVRDGIGTDKRIGQAFLYPGIGYGGSCFPKDVKAIIKTAADNGMDFKMLNAVETVNAAQKVVLVDKLKKHFSGKLKGKTVAVWGLAFKAETDDIRESPALVMIEKLLAEGVRIKAADPEAMPNVKERLGTKIDYFEDHYQCLENADALLIATEWLVYRNPDFNKIKQNLKAPLIFDGRNLYSQLDLPARGFTYYCIGSNNK
ncbi:MAG TPA: UDP-glucose/GDP-mannose dehydrogenase family protein [Spirochaetota bacterium]|nr:UDP-glucose/GDP-mannose dehydrogenase family protein [Spirochaetota bacterium]